MTTKYVDIIEFRKNNEEIIKRVTMWHKRGDRFDIVSSIWVEDTQEYAFLLVHKEILTDDEKQSDPFATQCKYIWLFKWELLTSEYLRSLLNQHEYEFNRVIQSRSQSATTAFEPLDGPPRSYLFNDEWE